MTSTDTMDNTASAEPTRSRRGKGEGLSSMVIPELRKMATELGIKRTSGMRKGDLIEAIQTQLKNSGQQAQGEKTQRSPKRTDKTAPVVEEKNTQQDKQQDKKNDAQNRSSHSNTDRDTSKHDNNDRHYSERDYACLLYTSPSPRDRG